MTQTNMASLCLLMLHSAEESPNLIAEIKSTVMTDGLSLQLPVLRVFLMCMPLRKHIILSHSDNNEFTERINLKYVLKQLLPDNYPTKHFSFQTITLQQGFLTCKKFCCQKKKNV